MSERRTPWCEDIDLIELVSVDQFSPEQPRHFLEYAKGRAGTDDGPYRIRIPMDLMTWLTVAKPEERHDRALHVLRVHLGEAQEQDMKGCPSVPRRGTIG